LGEDKDFGLVLGKTAGISIETTTTDNNTTATQAASAIVTVLSD